MTCALAGQQDKVQVTLGLNPEKSVSKDSAALSWLHTVPACCGLGLGQLVLFKPRASLSQPPPPGKCPWHHLTFLSPRPQLWPHKAGREGCMMVCSVGGPGRRRPQAKRGGPVCYLERLGVERDPVVSTEMAPSANTRQDALKI